MNNNYLFFVSASFLVSFVSSAAVNASTAIEFDVKGACRTNESWKAGSRIEKEWFQEFENFISGKSSIARGFSEALAMRKQGLSLVNTSGKTSADLAVQKHFSEYWIARALFAGKLYHQAHQGFSMIAKSSAERVIQKAVVQCLGEIQKKVPSLVVPVSISLEDLRGDAGNADAVFLSFLNNVGASKPDLQKLKSVLELLQSYQVPHFDFAEAIYYSRSTVNSRERFKNYQKSVEAYERFFSHSGYDNFLRKYLDSGRILLARAYYSLKQYSLATKNFHLIKKNSNELTEVLSELSWSYLMSGHYEESVGVVMQLRARGFKNTFTPEASMVSAMAFNELCQYPASLSALQTFKNEYAAEYTWLKRWSESPKGSLYSDVVQFIRGKKDVPVKIGNEWIRSSSFLTRQDELNLVLKQSNLTQQMTKSAKQEIVKMRKHLTVSIVKFIDQYRLEKSRLKSGEKVSASLYRDFQEIRTQFLHFYRFNQAAKPWRNLAKQFQMKLPELRVRLVASIEKDLTEKNRKMLSLLQEIAENNELIAAEIYTGASQDLVWKNAHPDYHQVVEKFEKGDANRRPASEVWNWGKVSAGENDSPEVWEDEVGFAKADLADHCSDKEKYLKVKASAILNGDSRFVKRANL